MRKEDLKNWTLEQMKGEILRLHRKLELFGIKFEENPNNFSFSHHGNRYYAGKLVNDYVALKEENSLIKSEYNDAINSFTSVSIDNENLRRRIAKLESDICGTSPCIVSEFHSFEGESYVKAATYDEVLYKLKRANDKVYELTNKLEKVEAENTSLMDSHIKLYNDTKDIIRSLKEENQELEQKVQYERDRYDRDVPFFKSTLRRDDTIAKLQDQHQQDCIKINQLNVTIDTLVDKYSMLRKTVGMD